MEKQSKLLEGQPSDKKRRTAAGKDDVDMPDQPASADGDQAQQAAAAPPAQAQSGQEQQPAAEAKGAPDEKTKEEALNALKVQRRRIKKSANPDAAQASG